MAFAARDLPPGYERLELEQVEGAVLHELAPNVTKAVASAGTLFGYASKHPQAHGLYGRGIAYAIPLPDTKVNVVVRHSRHGGAFARLTGDRFLAPTRAPRELQSAYRLAEAGVPTPRLVAALTYPAGMLLRRSDVATEEIEGGRDLSVLLARRPDGDDRRELLHAVGQLLGAMTRAGARHADLNLKNVLCSVDDGNVSAYVLDVDRVVFRRAGDAGVLRANMRRLARSARKWHALHGLAVTDADFREIERAAQAATR